MMTIGNMIALLLWSLAALMPTCSAFSSTSLSQSTASSAARRVLQSPNELSEKVQSKTLQKMRQEQRRLEDEQDDLMCDTALAQCMGIPNCLDCFGQLSAGQVDWASIAKDSTCNEALDILYGSNLCLPLKSDASVASAFCLSFDSCLKGKKRPNGGNSTKLDCSKLTSCEFEGMHRQFLGDGICHDNFPGCYNTEICGWDGGDCCEDSCESDGYCGLEKYACRDPQSINCDSSLSEDCGGHEDWQEDDDVEYDDYFYDDLCGDGETQYRLIMYDSFGDGWEDTKIKVTDGSTVIFEGALENGAMAVERICLKSLPNCYNVVTSGGQWGKEATWEVKPTAEGAPTIASGGSPMTCQFPAAGVSCENTCKGRTDLDPTKDPNYKTFKQMTKCIEEKCVIQMNLCNQDPSCKSCFEAGEATPDYCYGLDTFTAVIECSLCSCTGDTRADFCMDGNGKEGEHSYGSTSCTSSQTVAGADAILEFSNCTNFDQVAMLMIEFDNEHFGDLDTFEACAHEFARSDNRGGRTAQSCMKILVNAMNFASQVTKVDETLTEAIAALAGLLYENGEDFCDCASDANSKCPLCSSFVNFKTLLYEAVDACTALDEIDCAAWSEFAMPCRNNLVNTYTNVDFNNANQCQYVHDGCGGAGPFPSFRRLDCDVNAEVSTEAWNFYKSFQAGCLNTGDGGYNPNPTPGPPVPSPTPAPAQPNPAPYPNPYSPTDGGSSPNRKPYVPYEDRDKKDSKNDVQPSTDPVPSGGSSESNPKKKSHFFRNFFWLIVLGGAGYLYYKTFGLSLEGFEIAYNYVSRFIPRRGGNRYDSGDAMYSGLSLESSTTFEPASLPPPPSAVDNNYYI